MERDIYAEYCDGYDFAVLTKKNGFNLETVREGLVRASGDFLDGYRAVEYDFPKIKKGS
jgi:hypothetical protein